MMPNLLRNLFILIVFIVVDGCAYEAVKPWHRGELASDNAQLITDQLESGADEHIYFSKEAANGGQGVAGGGCGCN